MGTKMKGIYKGFKYTLTHMFVVKEREMDIGNPTDVKHVAHIGWDGPSGNAAPSWMNEFRTGPDFASTSIGRSGSTLTPWSSQDFGGSMQHPSESDVSKDTATSTTNGEIVKKKEKRKKTRSSSSPKSSSSFSGRSSRGVKSKSKYIETDATTTDIKCT